MIVQIRIDFKYFRSGGYFKEIFACIDFYIIVVAFERICEDMLKNLSSPLIVSQIKEPNSLNDDWGDK